jgi:hypothetical protein
MGLDMPFLSDTHCGVISVRKFHRTDLQSTAHVMSYSMILHVKLTENTANARKFSKSFDGSISVVYHGEGAGWGSVVRLPGR